MDKNNGAYTIHVYDKNGNPDENSELDCVTFTDLDAAKKMAMEYLSNNGGIIDISYDSDDSDDPEFVWSSEHDLELRLKILEDKLEETKNVIRKYFEIDPWTCEENPKFDDCFTTQDAIDEIVDILAD